MARSIHNVEPGHSNTTDKGYEMNANTQHEGRTEHTSGPWHLIGNSIYSCKGVCIAETQWGEVGHVEYPHSRLEAQANAEFIVRACNAHKAQEDVYIAAINGRRELRAAYRKALAVVRAVEPFAKIITESSGPIPTERLSLSDWHSLSKAMKEFSTEQSQQPAPVTRQDLIDIGRERFQDVYIGGNHEGALIAAIEAALDAQS